MIESSIRFMIFDVDVYVFSRVNMHWACFSFAIMFSVANQFLLSSQTGNE